MSVEGLCQVCESAPAEHRCDRCGALVCGAHFDAGSGLCIDCAPLGTGAGDGATGDRPDG